MTLDDYFAVPDDHQRRSACSTATLPCDGSTAVIVSAAEHAANVDHPVARVEAVGTALRGRPSWDQFDDMTTMAARDAGAQLWTRTDLTPADVDIAELYDGFSFLTMTWLEALGFCGKGESGPFIEGGAPHRARRRAARQHPRRPAVGRAPPRVRVHPRGRAAAAGRGRRPPGHAQAGRGGGGRQRRRTDRRCDAAHPRGLEPVMTLLMLLEMIASAFGDRLGHRHGRRRPHLPAAATTGPAPAPRCCAEAGRQHLAYVGIERRRPSRWPCSRPRGPACRSCR